MSWGQVAISQEQCYEYHHPKWQCSGISQKVLWISSLQVVVQYHLLFTEVMCDCNFKQNNYERNGSEEVLHLHVSVLYLHL